MKQILWSLSGIALVVWYAIDGWNGVFHAALAVLFGGGIVALVFRWRHARRQRSVTLIEPHDGFDEWHQALCCKTRQKFSVEEAYELWRRKLYEHPDLTLLLSSAVPGSEERQA